MRSSRRKRTQYVLNLRDKVEALQQRKADALEENTLLKQLNSLWTRLCEEVEAEIQAGVRAQIGDAMTKAGAVFCADAKGESACAEESDESAQPGKELALSAAELELMQSASADRLSGLMTAGGASPGQTGQGI